MDANAFDLQSAAEEEARMASMSADERKKYKQKLRKVCPAKWLSSIHAMPVPSVHTSSKSAPFSSYIVLCLLFKSQECTH